MNHPLFRKASRTKCARPSVSIAMKRRQVASSARTSPADSTNCVGEKHKPLSKTFVRPGVFAVLRCKRQLTSLSALWSCMPAADNSNNNNKRSPRTTAITTPTPTPPAAASPATATATTQQEQQRQRSPQPPEPSQTSTATTTTTKEPYMLSTLIKPPPKPVNPKLPGPHRLILSP